MTALLDPNWQVTAFAPLMRLLVGKGMATEQTAKTALDALMLPGDVYKGNVSMYGADGRTNPQVINRSADLAGMVTLGSGAIPADPNSLRMGIKAYKGAHPTIGGDVTDWKGRVVETRPEKRLMHDVPFESPGNPYAGFFSDSPAVASDFARRLSKDGGAVFPVDIDIKNPKVIDATGKFAAEFQFGPGKREEFLSYFDNHDGVILKNTKDEGTVIIPKKGVDIRSVYDVPQQPKGIKAYHGSPHDFDRFDMSKIGTGEGAQAYGHGLYFAENEGVAKSYKEVLASKPTVVYNHPEFGGKHVVMRGNDVLSTHKSSEAARRALAKIPQGRMYEVNIDADPNDFLDWDKPLSEQPQKVRDAVQNVANLNGQSGGYIWDSMVKQKNADGAFGEHMADPSPAIRTGPKAAQEEFRKAGIPGIKYLDAGSRGAGDGSRNYVVFDDKLISIVKKYGVAALVSAGVLSQAQGEELKARGYY